MLFSDLPLRVPLISQEQLAINVESLCKLIPSACLLICGKRTASGVLINAERFIFV